MKLWRKGFLGERPAWVSRQAFGLIGVWQNEPMSFNAALDASQVDGSRGFLDISLVQLIMAPR